VVGPTRFEIMPFARGEEEASLLPELAHLTVTCSSKYGLDHTLEFARRLRARGHTVTAHLAARMVRDRSHLETSLTALREAGIDDVFIIGGDATSPLGPYTSALELLPIIHQHPRRPRSIGIAGYPEGHPLIAPDALAEALEQKSQFADYVTTQLCFNSRATLAWVRAMRHAGVALPVIVGLPGIVNHRRLLEIAARVGVGPSIAFLRKQGIGKLVRFSRSAADSQHEALSPLFGDAGLGIAGLHCFTFNRLVDTWRWERARSGLNVVDYKSQQEVSPI
jgi:methylenetetrahydrofolate reductase (NADH)